MLWLRGVWSTKETTREHVRVRSPAKDDLPAEVLRDVEVKRLKKMKKEVKETLQMKKRPFHCWNCGDLKHLRSSGKKQVKLFAKSDMEHWPGSSYRNADASWILANSMHCKRIREKSATTFRTKVVVDVYIDLQDHEQDQKLKNLCYWKLRGIRPTWEKVTSSKMLKAGINEIRWLSMRTRYWKGS